MTSQQRNSSKKQASRKRVAAALCTAGVVAVALGSNLLSAGAQQAAVPGEPVAAAPTQVAGDTPMAQAASDPATSTATTSTTETTGTTSTPASVDPPTTTTPADTPTTTTPEGPGSAGGQPADNTPAAPSPDPAAAGQPAAPAPAAPAAPGPQQSAAPAPAKNSVKPDGSTPLPFVGFAGPALTTDPAPCTPPAKAAKKQATGPAAVGTFSGGGATSAKPSKDCPTKDSRGARDTVSPSRLKEDKPPKAPLRNDQGVPTVANPTTSLSLPGPVPVGVPNFFIDKFRIPPFLLPIYQAAGIQYGVRWEVLAAINEIETDYGRNLNVSSAGALGWMQFMPQTWATYGTDANRDGSKDPFNPVDAIFAAARYLKAAGAQQDLAKAIFSYNHADWYVQSVLMRARLIGGLPTDLVGSLSGLTQGHFPVFAKARYADDIAERAAATRVAAGTNAAVPVESDATRRGIDIYADAGSPAIAVQDGQITEMGNSARLGRYVKLRDAYGNTYTYAHLKTVATRVPVPKPKTQSRASIAKELSLPGHDPKPTAAASAGAQSAKAAVAAADVSAQPPAAPADPAADPAAAAEIAKERLFAHPSRPNALANGGAQQILELESSFSADESLKSYFTGVYGLGKEDVVLKPLAVGRRVIAGTILGRIGKTSEKVSPRLYFEIRPAGRGAPRIDPKPILDGWKLLESTALYRVQDKNPLVGNAGLDASIGQIMLMSKEDLAQRVLANPRIEIYSCGRR
ncbi:MAG: hypothetical protein QOE11_1728, partial [Solirubrobacteraceae bacterium]|nr:hypothetical protein [Solirubrobacteraceae bacterium]